MEQNYKLEVLTRNDDVIPICFPIFLELFQIPRSINPPRILELDKRLRRLYLFTFHGGDFFFLDNWCWWRRFFTVHSDGGRRGYPSVGGVSSSDGEEREKRLVERRESEIFGMKIGGEHSDAIVNGFVAQAH